MTPKGLLACLGSLALAIYQVEASCSFSSASWTNRNQGPKITQPSRSDPTKVKVDWKGMLSHPECASEITVWAWKKDTESMYSGSKKFKVPGPITKNTLSHIVSGIDPCVVYQFLVEYKQKGSALKGGESSYKTDGMPSMLSTDPTKVRVEYIYLPYSGIYDLRSAAIKFDVNSIIKYPNCASQIEIFGEEDRSSSSMSSSSGRTSYSSVTSGYNRPGHSVGPSSSSYGRQSSYSSQSSVGGYGGSRPGSIGGSGGSTSGLSPSCCSMAKLTPPFSNLGNDIVLKVPISACKNYRFALKVAGKNSHIGQISNIVMPHMGKMYGFKLPPVSKVIKTTRSGNTLKIDMHSNSPIPPSCLPTYLEAIDIRMASLDTASTGSSTPGHTGNDANLLKTLKEKGCQCTTSKSLLLTTNNAGEQKKHKAELGTYVFEGKLHEGKPYYVKKNPEVSSFIQYLHWDNKEKTWMIGKDLTGKKPILKMEKNVNTDCPGDFTQKKWQKKGTFSWSNIPNMKLACTGAPLSPTKSNLPSPTTPTNGPTSSNMGDDKLKSILREKRCTCSDSKVVKLSSADAGIQKKQKNNLGEFVFEGSLHEGKPYYVKRVPGSSNVLYLHWNNAEKTWWIANDLKGKKAVLKMEKNANTACPADVTSKQWQKKGMFSWSKIPSLKLVCGASTSSPGSRRGSVTSGGSSGSGGGYGPPSGTTGTSDAQLTATLKQKGCKCFNSPFVNVTSTDSRTNRKHKAELGKYKFEGQLQDDKPVYIKRYGGKVYHMYWNKKEKTWWIGADLLGKDALMKMDDNVDLACPADPRTKNTSHWMRKNSLSFWSDDETMRVICG